ncbi:oxidoreductase [Rhodococcus wratislaviensis]|uniref:Putative oxidoreductase n=1 Tax=Rhodococcus wratislaviensis NBRC 100605 TaxID=1219028 RepID=X0QD80_RHOWR|nr:NAD(P)-binding protein [Rhodococcus wratislaviensis]GAF49517.1 putative oxidoreductase [Rhodococcus wratislaviensis NBRC 100605]
MNTRCLSDTVDLGEWRLRNRFAATAHGTGAVVHGAPSDHDIRYWEGVARGGAALIVLGGGALGPTGIRQANRTEVWRAEAVPAMRDRARAISRHGALPFLQLTDLGRETLGTETFYATRSSSDRRSPREAVSPVPMSDSDLEDLIASHLRAGRNALAAEHVGVELHAAHGYLLGQMLSPHVTGSAARLSVMRSVVRQIVNELRRMGLGVGIRLSVGDTSDSGLDISMLGETLDELSDLLTYVNVTVGMRGAYVRDMSTERPPLLDLIPLVREACPLPLIVSHAFRDREDMEDAVVAGADLVGLARPLIAEPQLPNLLLADREDDVRPCVSCNEDCRSFLPSLLCSVNPDLAPFGEAARPGSPWVIRPSTKPARSVSIIGAGPAGLEAAISLRSAGRDVTVYDARDHIGGALAMAASVPHRAGWRRLLDYYRNQLERLDVEVRLGQRVAGEDVAEADAVILAGGSEEAPAPPGCMNLTEALLAGPESFSNCPSVTVVDDGFGWWPSTNVVEMLFDAGVKQVTFASPSTSFWAGIPAESRVQLMSRLRGRGLRLLAATTFVNEVTGASLCNLLGAEFTPLDGEPVIVASERRSVPLIDVPSGPSVHVIGDAVQPRKVAHAITEGRRAAELLRAVK